MGKECETSDRCGVICSEVIRPKHQSANLLLSPSAAEELSCLGVIQKKMTVNATDDSYDKARQSMAQAEEETRSRGAIVIKHGGRYQGMTHVQRVCSVSQNITPAKKEDWPEDKFVLC